MAVTISYLLAACDKAVPGISGQSVLGRMRGRSVKEEGLPFDRRAMPMACRLFLYGPKRPSFSSPPSFIKCLRKNCIINSQPANIKGVSYSLPQPAKISLLSTSPSTRTVPMILNSFFMDFSFSMVNK